MDKKSQIQKEIDAAMNSLSNLEPALPSSFFYTRVRARLMKEEKNIWQKLSRLIARPAIATTGICLVILLNTFVVWEQVLKTSNMPDQTEVTMADEYVSTTSFYDIDNVEH